MALYRRLDRQKMMINLMRIRRMPNADKRHYSPAWAEAALITVGECQELLEEYDPKSVMRGVEMIDICPAPFPGPFESMGLMAGSMMAEAARDAMRAAPQIKMPKLEMPKLDQLPHLDAIHPPIETVKEMDEMMRKIYQEIDKQMRLPSQALNSSGSSAASAELQREASTQKHKHKF